MPLLARLDLPSGRIPAITVSPFKGKIQLKKNSKEDYDSMLMAQCQQLYELWKKAGLIKDKKTPECSRAL